MTPSSLQAQFLVAVPQLPDSNFFRSVVLMIQHGDDGAFGVILNRPSEVTVQEVWTKVAESTCDCQQPIYIGGPVEGPLLAVHGDPSCVEREILPGVYLATQREHLDHLVKQTDHPVRLYSGYSGWGEGQLEGELEAGGWLLTPATKDHVFSEDDDLWRTVADEIGQRIILPAVMRKSLPEDPGLN